MEIHVWRREGAGVTELNQAPQGSYHGRKSLILEVGQNEKFYVEDGTVEFSNNNLLILSTTVQSLKNMKTEKISIMLKEAENRLSASEITDKQKYILNYKIETLKQIN